MSESHELALWRAVIAVAIQDATDWRSADVDARPCSARKPVA